MEGPGLTEADNRCCESGDASGGRGAGVPESGLPDAPETSSAGTCRNGSPDGRIVKFIRRHHVLALATCAGNTSWCANIFYAYVSERNVLIFTTDPETRHGRGMLENPKVSASIVLETRIVGRIRGLQISGCARQVGDGDGFARRAYLKRFPYAAAAKLDLWILEPAYMKFTDNTLGFGRKLIWDAEAGRQE